MASRRPSDLADLLAGLGLGGREGQDELRELVEGLLDGALLIPEDAPQGLGLDGAAFGELSLGLVGEGFGLGLDVRPEGGEVGGGGGAETIADALGDAGEGITFRRQLAEDAVEAIEGLTLGGALIGAEMLGAAGFHPRRGHGHDLVVKTCGPGAEEREAAED
jgi:hypothetical protein